MIISEPLKYAPFEWLDHVQREGLVFARPILEELGIGPVQQNRADSEEIAAFLASGRDEPAVAETPVFAPKTQPVAPMRISAKLLRLATEIAVLLVFAA